MFYVFSYTPTSGDTKANPHVINMELTAGIIHQVDVLFQYECEHKEFVKIFLGSHQLWPSNRDESIRGDAAVVSFREFFPLEVGSTVLKAHIWTIKDEYQKEVCIHIGILPKEVLQPLNFKELIAAAAGLD